MTTSRSTTMHSYFPERYVRRDRIGFRGQRAIAHIKALKDAARARRTERMKALIAQRLADIKSAACNRKGKR